jgi:hypothetical protein
MAWMAIPMRLPIFLLALAACCCTDDRVTGQSPTETNETLPIASPPEAVSASPPAQESWSPFRPAPGWFADLGGAVLHTHVSHEQPLFFGGGESEPVNNLGWNGAPLGIVGYHFAGGNALLASYRFLSASGNSFIPDGGHAVFIYNTLDLDYQGRIHGPCLLFTSQWQTGIRFDSVQYDTDVTNSSYQEATAQHFLGAGPHGGLNLAWYAGHTGLSFFARGDVGFLIGSTRESGTSQYIPQPNTIVYDPFGSNSHVSGPSYQTQVLLNARAQAGLNWVPPTRRWMRLEGGYLFDGFTWDAHIFSIAGPYLRYEVGF